MPGRTYQGSSSYRYGMNGQEKDKEIAEGIYTAEYWEYDSRTGRRWNRDPIVKPWESPYACFRGNPIYYADPSGLDGENPDGGCEISQKDANAGNSRVGDTYTDKDGRTFKNEGGDAGWQETNNSSSINNPSSTLSSVTTNNNTINNTPSVNNGDDRRRWRDSNYWRGGNGTVFDERGRELLGRWLDGSGQNLVTDNGRWGDYMKNNDLLTEQINQILSEDASNRVPGDYNVDITSAVLIENGYFTGYEMLHGTESTVGGLQIQGKIKIVNANTIEYQVKITWHDIIDPNPQYDTDTNYAETLDYFYNPKDYEVHLSWDQKIQINK